MKYIPHIIFSTISIFAFTDTSNAQPSPAGTAYYVYENADRFDGKSVTIYVRSVTEIRAKRSEKNLLPKRKNINLSDKTLSTSCRMKK